MDKFTNLLNLGYSVIPVDKQSKRPLIPWSEYQDRLAKEREVWAWDSHFTDCNVGIVTGNVSGIVVLDIDSREGYEEVKQRGLPPTPCVTTGKGIHYYFRHPGEEVRNFAGKIPGVDFRGDGGYVVAPGSLHAERKTWYEWRVHPSNASYAMVPRWVRDLLTTKEELTEEDRELARRIANDSGALTGSNYGTKVFSEEIARLSNAVSGSRNNTLFRVSVRLYELAKAGEVDLTTVEQKIKDVARGIGLKETEIRRTMESAYSSAHPTPRPALP